MKCVLIQCFHKKLILIKTNNNGNVSYKQNLIYNIYI